MANASSPATTVVVAGIDDSEHSYYALEWVLGRLFSSPNPIHPYKLFVVHSKPLPTSVIGLAGPGQKSASLHAGYADVLPFVESDLKMIASRVMEKAKELCASSGVKDVVYEVVEGDPRNALCETVDKHHADMLVVGSHGYGAIKRAVLGSVSDYLAHHAHCNVMIVKKPKHKH